MKKRILSMIFVLVFGAALAGCSGTKVPSAADVKTLEADMLAADDTLPEMTEVDSSADDAADLFGYLSDCSYDKVDSFFLAYSSEGLADEIAVVRMKKASDTDEMEESLKEHADGRVSFYKSYNPDQAERAEDAVVFVNDKDVVLIISDKQSSVKAAYEKVYKGE